jgi:hypothetical protein
MRAIICDQCKNTIGHNAYLTVYPELQQIVDPDEWHFCSWACLWQFATEKGGEINGRGIDRFSK